MINARYALNAANARWGSLYDALYGTDAFPDDGGATRAGGYNPVRGAQGDRLRHARFLDEIAPLAGRLAMPTRTALCDRGRPAGRDLERRHEHACLRAGRSSSSAIAATGQARRDPARAQRPARRDRDRRHHPIGATDPAGIADVVLEAAVTTIMDLEDSVAAVDADDKVAAYRNWLGLMKGTLAETFEKGGKQLTRAAQRRPRLQRPDGGETDHCPAAA